jgi:hypothetical protein
MQIRSITGKTGAANYIRERMNLYGLGYDLAKVFNGGSFSCRENG